MNKLFSFFLLVFLVSCSQEPKVYEGPFLIKEGVKYDQRTDQTLTGVVMDFYENGQLLFKENYVDGLLDLAAAP